MDALLFMIMAGALIFMKKDEDAHLVDDKDVPTVDMSKRKSKLNDNYYEDQKAFMEVAQALGFPKERR